MTDASPPSWQDHLAPEVQRARALASLSWEQLSPAERVESLRRPTLRVRWEALAARGELAQLRPWARYPNPTAPWDQQTRRSAPTGPARAPRRTPDQRREALHAALQGAGQIVVLEHFGLNGRSLSDLRKSLRDTTLIMVSVDLAREELAHAWPQLTPLLSGPTALLVARRDATTDLLRIARWAARWDLWAARPNASIHARGQAHLIWYKQRFARTRPGPGLWLKGLGVRGEALLGPDAVWAYLAEAELQRWRLVRALRARARQLEAEGVPVSRRRWRLMVRSPGL